MNQITRNKLSLVALIFVIPTLLVADQVCKFKLRNCPEDFNGKTIYVPENVTSVAPDFKICIPLTTVTQESSTPPSLMFIIDHSGSMMGTSGVDKDGSRFLVTQALLDTLSKKIPQAEVGLVVFAEKLYFNADDDSLFQKMPDNYNVPLGLKTQAYVPLMQLNKKQKNGMTGTEYLKHILKTKKIVSSVNRGDTTWSTDLVYQPTGFARGGGTHINVAFDAALDAMTKASFPKENQYIIFFSDGEANRNTSPVPTNQFEKGIGVPTTFTVFFTASAAGTAPQSLRTMTNNIKVNNYSATNPSSELWAIQTNFSALMDLVMKNIFNPLIFSVKQKPTTLVVNNKSFTTTIDSTTFNIGNGFKLNDSLTNFEVSVKYRIKDDSLKIEKDTSINVSFKVIRSNQRAMSEGIELDCTDIPPPDTTTIHITPNPFSPGKDEAFSPKIKTLFSNVINNNNSGMLIAVRSTAKLEKIPGTTDEYGTGFIYDAVGNLVTTIKMKKASNSSSDSTNYGFLWDCRNSNQRIVGIGTYLIKIRFKEANGQTRVFTRKIGVKE